MKQYTHKEIRAELQKLLRTKKTTFPNKGVRIDAPKRHGVYIIYSPTGVVVHVGRTPSGKNGLGQRLRNHMGDSSSFSNKYLKTAFAFREAESEASAVLSALPKRPIHNHTVRQLALAIQL